MKKVLAILGQLVLFGLFVVVFLGGTLLDPFHLKWFVSHPGPRSTRYFVPDGLILMAAVYVVVLGIEAAMKKVKTAGLWTSVVFLLALLVGILSKFGMATHDAPFRWH